MVFTVKALVLQIQGALSREYGPIIANALDCLELTIEFRNHNNELQVRHCITFLICL